MNNSGITNFNVLNTNALYIRGIEFDGTNNDPALQAQIDAIEQQLIPIEAITTRIDFSQQPLLIGNLVITEANKNSVLLTAIQALQQSIGNVNKLDLTALPAAPPASCIITPTTTNQALKALIDTNTGDITTIQNQITSINTSIAGINAKLAHFSTFTYGSDTMSGIADGTGFAVALGGGASGNGIFVYPNSSSSTAQIQMATAYDKEILIRGGDAVKIYGGNNGSITARNIVELGDKTDIIKIGTNNGGLVDFPEVEIGVDGTLGVTRDSSIGLKGDIYFSRSASSVGSTYITPYTPVMVVDTSVGVNFGNCNNFTTDPTFSGLDIISINPVAIAPVTISVAAGAIPISAALGLISLTALAGGITLATGAGIMTLNCGAGGFLLNAGAGVMNFAGGSAPINMTTITADITIGAGKGTGVSNSGNTILNADDNVIIKPDVATEIYKAAFVEMKANATAPAVITNRIYDISGALYYNGAALGGGGGSVYVLKAGDTMTGTLNLPEANTSILTLQNLTTAPSPVTNRLYLLNNVLTFNGVAVGGGGGAFVPLAGGTMTGALNINYNAGNVTPQLALVNTSSTAPTSTQGAQFSLRNDKTGNGAIGDRCGNISFLGKDSVGTGARNYASIQGFVNDPTSTSIDGRLSTFVTSANTSTEMLRLVSTSTGVRQVNIGATNTIIGATAIGAATTDTLRVQGSTSITTTLDVPLIQNAPAIYPATSTTLVDNAVRQYQPERLYRLIDYPTPLSAPTTTGEKVIILNNTGAPSGVDSIVQSSDFPTINSSTLNQIIQVKYVDSTNFTPACNYITAAYNDNTINVFVLPDIAGVLALTHIARLTKSTSGCTINDFVVTTYSQTNRLYFGGSFDTCQIPLPWGPVAVQSNNFCGKFVITWSGSSPNYTIGSVSVTQMQSNATGEDGGGIWGGVDGVNDEVTCVIDVTGNSGFAQPTISGQKYDSIVIGGAFNGIGPGGTTPQRKLQRLAYYDYYNAGGNAVTLLNQNITQGSLTNFGAEYKVMGSFSPAISALYTSFSFAMNVYYSAGPFSPLGAEFYIQIIDSNGSVLATSGFNGAVGNQNLNIGINGEIQLLSTQTYSVRVYTSNYNQFSLQTSWSYEADFFQNPPTPYAILTSTQVTGFIGWRTLSSTNWVAPVGPDDKIRGGASLSNGFLGFTYDGTTITTSTGSFPTNKFFSVYYQSGGATFGNISSDSDAINSGQTWFGSVNNVTGGNPVLAYGAGNAIAYSEIYLNRGTGNSLSGVYYRPSPNDAYEMTDSLIITDNIGLASYQLKPQFSSSAIAAVYRDDTKYPNVFFVGRGNELQTATLPFPGGIPNYASILGPTGAALPCIQFGGYSDEIGYTGLVVTTFTNVYIYKGSAPGELVIELSGCVVRCANNIYAQNKLVFPDNQDGTSIMLVGDTSIVNPYGKPSWWAISQDGGIYYDNVLVNTQFAGVTSVIAGTGIGVSSATGAVTISNSGVTSLTAGTNITLSAQSGDVTINASIPTPATTNGYAKWFFSDANSPVVIENTSTGSIGEVQFPFDAPTSTTGIGSGFVVGSSGRIRWTGLNPISIAGQISIQVTLQHFTNGTWFNIININQLPNQQPDLVGFGARCLVTDSQGNTTANSVGAYDFFISQTNSIDVIPNPSNVGGLVGNMTFNTNMRTNDEMYIIFCANGAFNTGQPANYRAIVGSNIFNGSNGGISFQISEMPFQ